jgi:hypothetical protein
MLKCCTIKVSTAFIDNTSQRGFDGRLNFNHSANKLTMTVSARGGSSVTETDVRPGQDESGWEPRPRSGECDKKRQGAVGRRAVVLDSQFLAGDVGDGRQSAPVPGRVGRLPGPHQPVACRQDAGTSLSSLLILGARADSRARLTARIMPMGNSTSLSRRKI